LKSFIAFSVVFLIFTSCADFNDPGTNQQKEYERQVEIYNQQVRKAAAQQAEADKQLKITTAQHERTEVNLKKSEEHIRRMDKLLDRWEKQADRYDALLNKWEKQAGIINK
jgi:septal ring factor EnvC (AmiA/AmiB activator)